MNYRTIFSTIGMLFYSVLAIAQSNSPAIISFDSLDMVSIYVPQEQRKAIGFQFRIVDSSAVKHLPNPNKQWSYYEDRYNFDLPLVEQYKTVKINCDTSKTRCLRYDGYSEFGEVHLLSYCGEICLQYLYDSYSGSLARLDSDYDEGVQVAFGGRYMLVYSTSDWHMYDYKSIIDVYSYLDTTNNLSNKFHYEGSIVSKDWTIELLDFIDYDRLLLGCREESEPIDFIEIRLD